jgi:hypothetical protein
VQDITNLAKFRDQGDPTAYCKGIFEDPRGVQRVFANETTGAVLDKFKSANAAQGDSLFTFLASRAQATFDILGCGTLLGTPGNPVPNPVGVTLDGKGVAIAATFTPIGTTATTTSTTTTSSSTSSSSTTPPVDTATVNAAPSSSTVTDVPPSSSSITSSTAVPDTTTSSSSS